jgi:copper chaperone
MAAILTYYLGVSTVGLDTATEYEEMDDMSEERERVYAVEGMTCNHCTAAVAEEVGALPGVTAVHVELDSRRLTVRGERVEDEAVAVAVAEAGYRVRP